MKRSNRKLFISLLLITLAIISTAPAIAHGQRDHDRAADRITMTWLIEGDSQRYEITAPNYLRLGIIKFRFILTTGLSIRHARDYLVEKVVTTTPTLPGRGPGQTTVPLPPGSSTSVTEYIPLDDRLRLREQDIQEGDILRIRLTEDSSVAGILNFRHKGHWHNRHDHRKTSHQKRRHFRD